MRFTRGNTFFDVHKNLDYFGPFNSNSGIFVPLKGYCDACPFLSRFAFWPLGSNEFPLPYASEPSDDGMKTSKL